MTACSTNYTVFKDVKVIHLSHQTASQPQFMIAHNTCIGQEKEDYDRPVSKISQLIFPHRIKTVPQWQNPWVSFQPRNEKQNVQRFATTSHSNSPPLKVNYYIKCMQFKQFEVLGLEKI